jgi:hypothetical protein
MPRNKIRESYCRKSPCTNNSNRSVAAIIPSLKVGWLFTFTEAA